MDSFNLRELRALQDENRSLKQMCAELSLDYQLNQSSKKALKPCQKRELAEWPISDIGVSIDKDCRYASFLVVLPQ